MSSCPPIRRGSGWRAALLVLMVAVTVAGAPGVAAEPPLVVVPVGTLDGQARLVVRVPDDAGGPMRPAAFSVALAGAPQPARAEPVLSEGLAMGLVVDASTEGSPLLPAGLGGAASFVLATPPSARSTLVVDGTPPTVAVPWPSGPAETLRGLSAVQPGGARRTAEALDLAVAQLAVERADPRIVVLYTGAPDAGGPSASAIVERLRSAGVLLAVVGSGSEFWTTVATGTGGVAVPAGPTDALGAFDRVASALGRSYLVTFPAPAELPASVTLRVETSAGALTSEIEIANRTGRGPGPLVAVAIGVGIAVILAAGLLVLRRARSRRARPTPAPVPRRRTASGPQVWGVPNRGEAAVVRESLLAELAATLHVGGPIWLRPHAGVSGLGMTTTMIDFAHRHRDRYDIAWWIPAVDPDLVADRMAELAEALELATPAESADQASARLMAALPRRHRWLLVFDDAGSPRELARYLPEGPGDVLIASSDPGWRELASPVTVPAFSRVESVSLLRSGRPDLAPERANQMAATLGDVPLSVAPVAALLTDTGMDVRTCPVRPGGRPAGGPDVVAPETVWAVMLDRLAADDPVALDLLTLVAWLGPAPLPRSLVVEHPHPLPEPLASVARRASGLVEPTALLRRRGLARVTADDLLLHPVPAELLIGRTGAEHAAEGGWPAIAVRLLRAAAPEGPAADPAGWSTWRRLLPHVLAATDPARRLDVVAADVGWLLAQAGGYLAARGRNAAARALLEDAHKLIG